MKGLSIPNISIPNISIPNISNLGINTNSIKTAINSAIPDLESIANGLDVEGVATEFISSALNEIELPSDS